jgi:thiosulfate reductase cytochrome b subunit
VKKVIKKHPLAIRWFHWINFPVIAIMIWSGMLIYWANDVYRVGFGDKTILKFFPTSFYKALHIPFRLAEGMGIHFVFMWFFAINGFIYVLYLIFSGEWRLIVPNKRSLKESWQVVLHDLHLRKTAPPQKKYNAAQRIAYSGVIIMGIGSVLTGLSIYKPIQFHTLCALLGGYEWARAEHFILTILFVLFFVVHVVQVILAGWNNFRSMVTGLDVIRMSNLQPAIINKESENKVIAVGNKVSENEMTKENPSNDLIEEDEKILPHTHDHNKENTDTTNDPSQAVNLSNESDDTNKIKDDEV